MSTTTSLRFSTQPKFPDATELQHLLPALGMPTSDQKRVENRRRQYYNYWKRKSRRLNEYGFNQDYPMPTGDAEAVAEGNLTEQIRQRYTRMTVLQRAPYLIPDSDTPPEMSFREFVTTETGRLYLNYCADILANYTKWHDPNPKDVQSSMIQFVAEQHNFSFCKTHHKLNIPYCIFEDTKTFVVASPSSDPEQTKTIFKQFFEIGKNHGVNIKDQMNTVQKEYHYEHVKLEAKKLASEIQKCTDALIMISIDLFGIEVKASGVERIAHRNSVILNRNTNKYIYFEPHMTSENTAIIPYKSIQEAVKMYLEEINPKFELDEVPVSCPRRGAGRLQLNDPLCVPWSVYTSLCFLLNSTIEDTSVITDSVSGFSLARMMYVMTFYIPIKTRIVDGEPENVFLCDIFKTIHPPATFNAQRWPPRLLQELEEGGDWEMALKLFSTNPRKREEALKALLLNLTVESWDRIPDRIQTSLSDLTRFNVTIPTGVTKIKSHAFYNCGGLTLLTIPEGVKQIGAWAFSGCKRLTAVTIPRGVTHVGDASFRGCSGLTSVTLPNECLEIGEYAFRNCSGLSSVTIPNAVTRIKKHTFYSCNGLTSVTLPTGITEIEASAFAQCTGLPSVVIPGTVNQIGAHAFSDCTGLTSVIIPEGVLRIEKYAFAGCIGLTRVSIPSTVTLIGAFAFSDCINLDRVIVSETTDIVPSAFPDTTIILIR